MKNSWPHVTNCFYVLFAMCPYVRRGEPLLIWYIEILGPITCNELTWFSLAFR